MTGLDPCRHRHLLWCVTVGASLAASSMALAQRPSGAQIALSDGGSADAAGLHHSALEDRAVLYLRRARSRRYQVVWQRGQETEAGRVIYETGHLRARSVRPSLAPPPEGVGVLPSPDGRWVHVWETAYDGSGASVKTVWLVVEVPTGRRLQIGEQPGGPVGYFPYWLDDSRLLLEKGNYATVFDVRTGLANPRFPAAAKPRYRWSARDIDVGSLGGNDDERTLAWGREYVRRHYSRELHTLRSAVAAFGRDLGLSSYLRAREAREWPQPDALEDLLLRPMGVVAWVRSKQIWPTVAISPGGEMLARTAFVVTGRRQESGLSGDQFLGYAFDARLDVYALPGGQRLWGKSAHQPWAQPRDTAMYLGRHGLASVADVWFQDPRWSSDGRYLSFTTRDESPRKTTVSVLDSSTWQVVLRIPDATDAFVVPVAK